MTTLEVKFAFVRHAMSVDNEAWLLGLPWPGFADAPLCSQGRKMLPSIAMTLAEWQPDLIVSSPLRRCIDTARAIAVATTAQVEIDYGLTEMPYNDGDLPMLPDLLSKAHPDLIVHNPLPNCSRDDLVRSKAVQTFRRLAHRHERKICLVGHRGWLMTFAGIDVENGELICLRAEFNRDFEGSAGMTITTIPRMW